MNLKKSQKECDSKLMRLKGGKGKKKFYNYVIISKNKNKNLLLACFRRDLKRIANLFT